MSSYLAFIHSGIETASENAFEDGAQLANDCISQLNKLEDREQFPPRLLILLASPAYLDLQKAQFLLDGINQAFINKSYTDVPLIGSSVAAVFFKHPKLENRVHERGALLVCLASRLIKARVAAGKDARKNPESAVKSLLWDLNIDPSDGTDPNPLANRILLGFLPGFGQQDQTPSYPAPELQRLLRDGLRNRIWTMGGVSSADDPNRTIPGIQFAGREVYEVYKDAVVMARITSGVPIGMSMTHGLSPTGRVLRVKTLAADKRTINEFVEGIPAKVLALEDRHVLLGRMSTDDEPMIAVPRLEKDGRSVQLLREIKEGDHFEVLLPEPEAVIAAAKDCIKQACELLLIQNPVASLVLPCNAWRLRFRQSGFDIERSLREMEGMFPDAPCVGGFVDGEVSEDKTGRAMFSNGSVVSMVFGGDLRQRTTLNRGFTALAKYGPEMTGAAFIEDAVETALRIVIETGFPGAMLSLLVRNGDEKYLVAYGAKGKHFERICDDTRRPLKGDDILAVVAREQEPHFIPVSSNDPYCDKKAVEKSGIISQYVIPLLRQDQRTLGILQVDLGDIPKLNHADEKVLNAIGAIIGSSLDRLSNWVETNIGRKLDQALDDSLSAPTVEEGLQSLVEKAAETFDAKICHVWLADHRQNQLLLAAGVGPYYEAARENPHAAEFEASPPIIRAFTKGDITIINDAQADSAYQQLCERHTSRRP